MMSAEEKREKSRESARRYRAKNIERVRENDRRSYHANKHRRAEKARARTKQWRIDNPEKVRRHNWKHHHGIDLTYAEYEARLVAQCYRCEICQAEINSTSGYVDHNHETGAIRGIVCPHCNFILGHVRDSVSILTSAIEYLVRYR